MCLLFHVNGHPYFKGSSHSDYKQTPQLCHGTDLLRGFLSLSLCSGWGAGYLPYPFLIPVGVGLFSLISLSRICCPYPSPTAQSEVCVCTALQPEGTLRKGCKPQFGGIQSHQGDTSLDVSVGSGGHFQRGLAEAGWLPTLMDGCNGGCPVSWGP